MAKKKSKRARALDTAPKGAPQDGGSAAQAAPAVTPAVTPAPPVSLPPQNMLAAALMAVLVFLLIIYTAAYSLPFYVGLPILLLAGGIAAAIAGWKPMEHITATSTALLAFVLMCGIASLYSSYQDFAYEAFGRWFILLMFFLLAVLACRRKHGRTLMLGIAMGIALTAIFSIDSASFRRITDFVIGTLMRIETSGFSYWGDGRISGLFVNPNISGSMFALGIFLSLYLASTAKRRGEQVAAYSSLALNSMAFLLSFSMGSIGFFAVGVVVYLLAVGKQDRPGVLLLMVETVLSTMVFSVIATAGLGKTGWVCLIPDLVMVLNCAVIWLLDLTVGARLSRKLAENGRAVGIAFGGVAALAAVYLVLGFNLTGGITLTAGESLSRSAYPAAGAYTLTAEGTPDLQVTITAQNSQQTAMHTSTTLYDGPAAGASFTVPEGTKVAYFALRSPQGGRLDRVAYSGGSEGTLKLKYLLLPEFAATRIQGLWANQNVIQRFTFFGDALRIWQQNPVFGKGMGAFEAYHAQVSDFYYVTRYAHNVYLQTMAETGIVGTLLLLLTIAAFVLVLLRGRRDPTRAPLTAPLLACLAMMWGHGSFEVIWSSKPYLVVAALVLALVQIYFGELLVLPVPAQRRVRCAVTGVCAAATVFFGTLFAMQPIYTAQLSAAQNRSYEDYMACARSGVRFNPYESDFYRVTYLKNVMLKEDEGMLEIADTLAPALLENNTYAYAVVAAEYYFARGEGGQAGDALNAAARRAGCDPGAWAAIILAGL
ncbi:MAG: O-antigen ligase family protein, partial [Pseudoflavonifractor sp.]